MRRLRLWTDGCCLRNPGGAGGWAYVLESAGEVITQRAEGDPATTNNRMELLAVIAGLEDARPCGAHIEVISDSKYVVDGCTSWRHSWKRNGWSRKLRGGGRSEVKNSGLWKRLDGLLDDGVLLRWVKGHDGSHFNELADELAGAAARRHR